MSLLSFSSRIWRRQSVQLLFWLLCLGLALNALGTRYGLVPPLGAFLNPYAGIWAHQGSRFETSTTPTPILIEGLHGNVEVQVDNDQVKHIFATSDEDLYFAQGYVIAHDRLWQMEFITRLASGRLSEVFGRKTLELDRFFIKIGLPEAADESARLMMSDPITGPALRAYSRGVNAYIREITPETLPFEYKLLGTQPEAWSPEKAALLLKFMTYNLTGRSFDLALTRSQARLNPDDFESLYSLRIFAPEPIVPKGTQWSFESRAPAPPTQPFHANLRKLAPHPTPHPSNGSNNWAVTAKKSSTGYPILSNDIHLGLSLPPLWYEVQLVSPSQNVYGVALPGAPGVILGFNRNLAWGVTNAGADVLDWYELRYRDDRKNEYLFDGNWRPVISRESQIQVRGEAPEIIATRKTHLGPIVYDETEVPLNPRIPRGLAMRWAGLDPSNELKTFIQLNQARSTKECREALETYQAPAQNFICADSSNDVGLWHMGRFPVRWRGQGRTISDGSQSGYEWSGWIPREEVPFVRNPRRGFVSSANQDPADAEYPHYLGWPFDAPFRGMRINEILRSKAKFSPEDMIEMQKDTLSLSARMVLPLLLEAVEKADLTEVESKAIAALTTWDYRYEADSVGAALFYHWFGRLEDGIWYPQFGDRKEQLYPPMIRTIELIQNEPDSKWFDLLETSEKETLANSALAALRSAIKELIEITGVRDISKWRWSEVRKTQIEHIGKIPGLGMKDLKVRGMEHTIFANHGHHGPVWKMVVALGPTPKAWGVFPGGQSGDPVSRFYDNFLKSWGEGEMRELVYLSAPGEKSPRLHGAWTLEKK